MRRNTDPPPGEHETRGLAPPDRNPWVEAMARTLTEVAGSVLIIAALGVGGALGDLLANRWHGPANPVWQIYAAVGGLIGAALAVQVMLLVRRLSDRQRVHYIVLLVGMLPGVGLVVLIFASTNWFLTRTFDERARREADRGDGRDGNADA